MVTIAAGLKGSALDFAVECQQFIGTEITLKLYLEREQATYNPRVRVPLQPERREHTR